jgi:hypothetical protein
MNFQESFFSDLLPKDWITLLASISALIFSLITYQQRRGEGRINLRKQLTDLLEKLSGLNANIYKYKNGQNKKEEYPPNYIGLMNDQRRLLVKHADFIASKAPKMIASYEYLVIAGAFDGIDETTLAEKYYNLSVNTARGLEKCIASRAYARYLFNEGLIEFGRGLYEDSISCIPGLTDRLVHFRIDTYLRWAEQERDCDEFDDEKLLLQRAQSEIDNYISPLRRQIAEAKLAVLLSRVVETENGDPN